MDGLRTLTHWDPSVVRSYIQASRNVVSVIESFPPKTTRASVCCVCGVTGTVRRERD